MKACNITVSDEVFCNVAGLHPQDHAFLEDKFALHVEGYMFMPLYKLGRWDGKVRFFDRAGKVYQRLLPDVLPHLEAWGYDVTLHDRRPPVRPVEARIGADWFLGRPGVELRVELREYQVQAVNACLEAGSGFCEMATGSGKTLVTAALADVMARSGVKTMVIVPSADLVEQTACTFRLCALDVGTYSGSAKDFGHDVVVCTWQSLQNNPGLMREGVGCVLVDECHGVKAKVVGDLLNVHGCGIPYRFGFTGTMPKPAIDRLMLRGAIGEVLFEVPASMLMEQGYLAQLEIEPVEIHDAVGEEFPDYASEKAFLGRSPERLDLLADLVIAKAQRHGNTLVLVNSIKQGQQLHARIRDSVFLYGASESDVRAEWYSTFETRDDLIVIATFGIASVGISIDRVFCLVMVDTGRSFIKVLQSIGRSLRKGRDKDRAHVVDVHSKLKWSMRHFRERLKYYRAATYAVGKAVKYKL